MIIESTVKYLVAIYYLTRMSEIASTGAIAEELLGQPSVDQNGCLIPRKTVTEQIVHHLSQ